MEDLASQCWSAEIAEQGCSLRMHSRWRAIFTNVAITVEAFFEVTRNPRWTTCWRKSPGSVETCQQFPKPGAVGESQSNGFAERAVLSIEEMIRTHKIALEVRLGEKVNITHPGIGWLIEHCEDICLHDVALVGGSARISIVQEMFQESFNEEEQKNTPRSW